MDLSPMDEDPNARREGKSSNSRQNKSMTLLSNAFNLKRETSCKRIPTPM